MKGKDRPNHSTGGASGLATLLKWSSSDQAREASQGLPFAHEQLAQPDPLGASLSDWLNRNQITAAPPASSDPLTPAAAPRMGEWLDLQPAPRPEDLVPRTIPEGSPSLALLKDLAAKICRELQAQPHRLFQINRSRREAIAEHLARLAGQTRPEGIETSGELSRWVQSQGAEPLQAYFEEVALIALSQALLLKSWSDRGLRKLSEADLSQLNWALSSALKPHVPLDREGWHLTRPNLYSWYNPGPELQKEIWRGFQSFCWTEEGPQLLLQLSSSQGSPSLSRGAGPNGYDSRFYQSLWDALPELGFSPEPANAYRTQTLAYTPTLRDGALVRRGPPGLHWIALEASPLRLLFAEIMQLWWGPSTPPLWAQGYGLETLSKDQLSFSLPSARPSVFSRISEIESCDLSVVLEERATKSAGRGLDSGRFRSLVEAFPALKKLKSAHTSMGTLQALVALQKLRPGGMLLWAREEPLTAAEGVEVLGAFLERARLLCEWEFASLEHALPAAQPLFPKFLYLFSRDIRLDARLQHRPLRLTVRGNLRSHVELPMLLGDALLSAVKPVPPRGGWRIDGQISPWTQKEWADRWPNRIDGGALERLELLKTRSLNLAGATTVRPTPEPLQKGGMAWTLPSGAHGQKGLWIRSELTAQGRVLVAERLPRAGKEARGSGFVILVADEAWVAPLCKYLGGPLVRQWLDHHAERKGERWVLTDQIAKWIPIPQPLLEALRAPATSAEPLPGDWERLIADALFDPKGLRKALETNTQSGVAAHVYVRVARALEAYLDSQNQLMKLVDAEGNLRWRELLDTLPKSELMPITLHPGVKWAGSLAAQIPIARMVRTRSPQPGWIFATEGGLTLRLTTQPEWLSDLIEAQLEGMMHPTWNELTNYLRLPRSLELATSTAQEILKAHREQSAKIQDLEAALELCQLF